MLPSVPVTPSIESKIGLFVFNQADEYHRRLAEEAQEAARHHGVAVQVYDAVDTAAKQAQDLVRFAAENPGKRLCALIVPFADAIPEGMAVQDDATYRLARRILQKGVGWVMLNHGRADLVTALHAEFPSLPLALVAIDNLEFGRIQARLLRAHVKPGAKVLCVRGNPFDSGCQERSAGLKEGLRGGGIDLEEVDGRWDPAIAETEVRRWITSPLRIQTPLHAVVAQDDVMGMAARRALDRAARELGRADLRRLPIIGGDGLSGMGRRWVDEGALTATVSVTLPGKTAVDLLWRHWKDSAPLPAVTRLAPTPYSAPAAVGRAGLSASASASK
jgi:ABC-type sugar transport system substrate-binding protein